MAAAEEEAPVQEQQAPTPPPDLPPQPLSESLMDLGKLERTVDGTGYVYKEVSCVGKRINAIKAIDAYVHLQILDFSSNLIKDIAPLKGLQYLVKLNLSQNAISSLKGLEPAEGEEPPEGELMPHLQHLDLSGNAFTALTPLPLKALKTLNLSKNQIATCQEFTGHERLESLDLGGNQLTSLAGVAAMPALTKLSLASNELTTLEGGLAEVPALKELDLSSNKLVSLDGPWQDLPELGSLDVSKNELQAFKSLEVLRALSKLRNLDASENPCVLEAEEVSAQMLICHWRLSTVNGSPVTEDQLEKAKELNVVQILDQRAKAKADAEAAAAAEGGDD